MKSGDVCSSVMGHCLECLRPQVQSLALRGKTKIQKRTASSPLRSSFAICQLTRLSSSASQSSSSGIILVGVGPETLWKSGRQKLAASLPGHLLGAGGLKMIHFPLGAFFSVPDTWVRCAFSYVKRAASSARSLHYQSQREFSSVLVCPYRCYWVPANPHSL